MRIALLLAAMLCTGCPTAPEPVTFVTYNAGLAVGFVPAAEDRTDLVASALAGLQADVICLQEVWLDEQVDAVKSATSSAFPHSYFPEASQELMESAACVDGDSDGLVECLDEDCGEACVDEIVDCLFEYCVIDFLTLSKDCARCAQAHVGTAEASEVAETCNNGGIEYAYGGSFGTGLLSKHPLSSVTETVFDSTTNRRSVLEAVVSTPAGDVDVMCTHLTAGLSLVPYPRETGSWEEEQAVQVGLLVDMLEASSGPTVLMGDLNNGPASTDVDAEFEDNYDALIATGVSNPYLDLDGRCTFCDDNDLSGADSDETGRLIDHVLLKGMGEVSSVARVLDDAITVETCVESIDGAYSDHYGVSVTVFVGE